MDTHGRDIYAPGGGGGGGGHYESSRDGARKPDFTFLHNSLEESLKTDNAGS